MKSTKNLIHWLFTGAYLVAAILTVIPVSTASKASRLGYKALCSFSPYGTIILLGLGILHIVLILSHKERSKR